MSTLVSRSDLQQLPESEDDENWRKLCPAIDAGGRGETQEAQTVGGPQPVDETEPDGANE